MFRVNNKPVTIRQNSQWEEDFQLRRSDYGLQVLDPERLTGFLSKSIVHGSSVSVPLQFYATDTNRGAFRAFLPADVTANLSDHPYFYAIYYAVSNQERYEVARGNAYVEVAAAEPAVVPPEPTQSSVFYFPVPTTTWEADHNLDRYPFVRTYDQFNAEIEGSVDHVSQRRVVVTFLLPVSGVMRLA